MLAVLVVPAWSVRPGRNFVRDLPVLNSSDFLNSWVESLLIGITRCGVGSRSCSLEDYYRRHREDIEAHPERDRIIEAFRARKEEIAAIQDAKTKAGRYG
jgi:hypothetical protein